MSGIPVEGIVADSNGAPVTQARIISKKKGTSTDQALYEDEALTTPASNPYNINNSAGFYALYRNPLLDYSIEIKSADEATTYNSFILNGGGEGSSSTDPNIIVDTLAELQALTGDDSEDSVLVLGRASAGDGYAGMFRWVSGDQSANVTADPQMGVWVAPTAASTGASGAWMRVFTGEVWAEWFGASTSATAATNATAILAAVDYWAPFNDTTTDGGMVRLGVGVYACDQLVLTGKHGITLRGSGINSTELSFADDESAIVIASTVSTSTNKLGIEDMTIHGPGLSNTSAYGIDWTYTNRCFVKNVLFHGWRRCLSLVHNWQTVLQNVDGHGAGTDQHYIGLYMGESTNYPTEPIDNAIEAINVHFQDSSYCSFRIVNGQGSKFTNCEGSSNVDAGTYGWYIGDGVDTGTPCQWIHFSNCLADTVGNGWYIVKGSMSELSQMQWSNCWCGNTITGWTVTNADTLTFDNTLQITSTGSAIVWNNVNRSIWQGQIRGWRSDSSGSEYAFSLIDCEYNRVFGHFFSTTSSGTAVSESGTSNNNVIEWTGSTGFSMVGADSLLKDPNDRLTSNGDVNLQAFTSASTGDSGVFLENAGQRNWQIYAQRSTDRLVISHSDKATEAWHLEPGGIISVASSFQVGGTQVLSAQGAAVADASGGSTVDAEARTAINTLLARLRAHGMIAT